jgi:hypothetical protein
VAAVWIALVARAGAHVGSLQMVTRCVLYMNKVYVQLQVCMACVV